MRAATLLSESYPHLKFPILSDVFFSSFLKAAQFHDVDTFLFPTKSEWLTDDTDYYTRSLTFNLTCQHLLLFVDNPVKFVTFYSLPPSCKDFSYEDEHT